MSDRHNEEYGYVIGPQEWHGIRFEDSEMEIMMINVAQRLETLEYGTM